MLRTRRTLLSVSATLFAIALFGCTHREFDFTLLTTRNIDLAGLEQGERVTGEDCALASAFYWGWPSTTVAMIRALENGKGDILVDVDIKRKFLIIGIGVVFCDEVTGTIARTASYKKPATQ